MSLDVQDNLLNPLVYTRNFIKIPLWADEQKQDAGTF